MKILILALLIALSPTRFVQAAPVDSKMFSAGGIQVDVTAENASKAREQALQEGQKHALMAVMSRITPDYIVEQLPELVPDDIINFVQDMSVSNEKTSPVRYMATLEVRFNGDAVRDLLKSNGLPFVRTSGKPLLILPLYRRGSSSRLLWEEDNAWLRAWSNRTVESYMIPLIVPMGDLQDSQMLTAEQVVKGDLPAVLSLAKRYEAEGVLVVEMTRTGSGFNVSVNAMDETTASEIKNFSFSVPMGKNTATTYANAVRSVVERLERKWKEDQMVQFNDTTSLVVMVPVSDIVQWQTVKDRLSRVPIIGSYTLQAARAGVLQLTIFYAETLDRLQNELKKRKLLLSPLPSGVFKLQAFERLADASAPAKPADSMVAPADEPAE